MRMIFPTIMLLLLSSFGVAAQSSAVAAPSNPFPTVSTLTKWASYNSQNKFDLDVRNLLGFKFEEKESDNISTTYTYVRKVVVNNITYTDRIVYRITKDNTQSVISLVTASTDLVSYYSPQLTGFNRGNCDSEMSKAKTTTCSCYENKEYVIDVCDERVKLSMGDGNKYFISVAKK